ncbi:proline-rich receptor-like protein kinase PERK2 [Iris pallida]|uniref:Proline-rich receptor-like protein kinase PERK2 n=1 Tax=Iris pallida TaxID=29817 RepID=A0AAX6HMU1_IRIPA|nr:proline-rich receptor-like protein kinase PERK2 [Iris pallida]
MLPDFSVNLKVYFKNDFGNIIFNIWILGDDRIGQWARLSANETGFARTLRH